MTEEALLDNELINLFQNTVSTWLDLISKGTNKKIVQQLLSPKGISYTFGLPKKESRILFDQWVAKNKKS